jgi:acyl-CoA thioesterase FadM/predicted MFS family arabinose efflux permease
MRIGAGAPARTGGAASRVLAIAGLGFGGFHTLLSVVPAQAETVGGSAGPGSATAVLMLATMAAQVTVWRTVRVRVEVLMAFGCLLLSVPAFLYALDPPIGVLLAVTAIRGVGFGVLAVAVTARVSALALAGSQGRAIGRLGLVTGISGIVGSPLGLYLWDHSPVSAHFLGGFLPLGAAVLALQGRWAPTAVDLPTRNVPRPGLTGPVLGFAAASFAYAAALTVVPVFAPSRAAPALLAVTASLTVSRWIAGRPADRWGPRPFFLSGLLLAGVGALGVARVGGAAFYIPAAVLGIGFGLAATASFLLFVQLYPRGAAGPAAIWNIVFDSGIGVGGLGIAALSTTYAYGTVLQLTGLTVLAFALLVLLLPRSRPEVLAMTGAPAAVRQQRRIDWIDTDASGIHHWSTFARLTDAAEALLFDRLGLGEAYLRMPRVAVEAQFRWMLRFNDVVEVLYRVDDVGRSSVRFRFEVTLDGRPAIEGTTTAVLIGEDERSKPWPDAHRCLLETAGEQTGEMLADRAAS